jgi:hypothetical protein
MKGLLQTIVGEAVKRGYYYGIDCGEGYEFTSEYFFQHPTQDLDLLCNQKPEDQYIGMDNLDEGHIFFFTKEQADRLNNAVGKVKFDHEIWKSEEEEDNGDYYEGWIMWSNWNDGVERVCDYTTNLDDLIGLRETTDKWEEMVTEFTNKL